LFMSYFRGLFRKFAFGYNLLERTMKYVFWGILLWAPPMLWGQVSFGGQPWSSSEPVVEIRLPAVNVDSLLAADAIEEAMNLPFRFGYPIALGLSPDRVPEAWSEAADGTRLWRTEIWSPGAYSMNFIFDYFRLPEGTEMYLYTPDKTYVRGKFDIRNVREHGKLGVAPLPGDRVVVEYRVMPGAQDAAVPFVLGTVVHGYKDVFFNKSRKGFGDSGSCNINVNCPQGADWQNAKKGVAMILSASGSRLCTGSLINDVPQSGTPYFLTADHCHGNDVAAWVFMFNYESPSCDNVDGPTQQTISGCTVRARHAPSDMMLLELNDRPQYFYDVWYNGWNREDLPAPQSVVIHHPRGDVKKITFENDPLISSTFGSGGNADTHWATGTYEEGTTEPGSSGSPIFNGQQQIVGQLHGGPASCTSLTEDYFGKVAVSWNGGGTPGTQLSHWLDPQGTGANAIAGGLNAAPIANLSGTPTFGVAGAGCPPLLVTFTAQAFNFPPPYTSITWNFPGGSPSVYSAGMTPPPILYSTPGTYDVRVEICNADTCIVKHRPQYIRVVGMISALPFVETFEDEAPSWQMSNPDGSLTWDFATVQGSAPGNRAAVMPFYNYPTQGQRDGLISPVFDFTGYQGVRLRFEYAYPRSSFFVQALDSLIVYYSTNCGQTWQRLWARAEGAVTPFATAPAPTFGGFTPSQAAHWCHSTTFPGVFCPDIPVPQVAGLAGVRFKFEGYNRHGNNLYLDNIRLSGISSCTLNGAIYTNRPMACIGDAVTFGFEGNAASDAQYEWTVTGGSILGSPTAPTIDVRRNEPGTAVVSVRVASEGCVYETQREFAFDGVAAVFSAQPNPACAGDTVVIAFTGNPSDGVTYQWDFGTGNVLSGQGPGPYRVVWNENGDLPVRLVTREGMCESMGVRLIRMRKPDAKFVVSTQNACVGEPILVTFVGSTPAQEHIWDFGGGAVESGTGPGPYVVVYPQAGAASISHLAVIESCAAQFRTGLTINDYPQISHPYDGPINVRRERDTIFLQAFSDGQWVQWDFGGGTVVEDVSSPGTSAFRVVWMEAGMRQASVWAGNGPCVTDTLRIPVEVGEWTRRPDSWPGVTARVYPQPAGEALTVHHPHPGAARLTLYDVTGRAALERTFAAGEPRTLPVHALPEGVYALRLTIAGPEPQTWFATVVVARP
jgi:PKD repeat protein